MFHAFVVLAADQSCSLNEVGVCHDGNYQHNGLTPAVKDVVRIKESYQAFLANGTPKAADIVRLSGMQLW